MLGWQYCMSLEIAWWRSGILFWRFLLSVRREVNNALDMFRLAAKNGNWWLMLLCSSVHLIFKRAVCCFLMWDSFNLRSVLCYSLAYICKMFSMDVGRRFRNQWASFQEFHPFLEKEQVFSCNICSSFLPAGSTLGPLATQYLHGPCYCLRSCLFFEWES